MYLNKAIIIGNLTRDPELKSLPSGVSVAEMGVATNRVWKDKDGNKKEDTQFHNIVIFGRQAETTAQYLKKGSSVLIEGRMQTRSWDAQDGTKRYRTEVVADRVQFGPRGEAQAPAGEATGNAGPGLAEQAPTGGADNAPAYPDEEINPDDIPF